MGLTSQNIARTRGSICSCISAAVSMSPASIAEVISDVKRGAALLTTLMTPAPPIAMMGTVMPSSPLYTAALPFVRRMTSSICSIFPLASLIAAMFS